MMDLIAMVAMVAVMQLLPVCFSRRASADMLRKNFPIVSWWVLSIVSWSPDFTRAAAGPYPVEGCPLPLLASAANLATNDASAVSELGPKFPAICLRIASSFMDACLAASAKTLSVSTFASAMDSSTPEPRCCGVAVSDAGAAGADDEEAAVDAVCPAGPYDCAGPCGDGPCCDVLRCVCGSPRASGREVRGRFGPCVGGFGTT